MKKITLTADEALLKRAQAKARAEKTTLTAEFRRWLEEYATVPNTSDAVEQGGRVNRTEKKQAEKPEKPEKLGITLAGCVDAFKKFEKKLEEKL